MSQIIPALVNHYTLFKLLNYSNMNTRGRVGTKIAGRDGSEKGWEAGKKNTDIKNQYDIIP